MDVDLTYLNRCEKKKGKKRYPEGYLIFSIGGFDMNSNKSTKMGSATILVS
jgi:hypothetical protein